ncbi:MAG: ATP-binding protein [Candidatus Eisenbacteria bacterium]
MQLKFLNRTEELRRLRAFLKEAPGGLAVLYGRRRCGKSRLLLEVLTGRKHAYYVGDHREAALQRHNLAIEVGRLIPGFDRVRYPDWTTLFDRFWNEAPRGACLALDEFPAIVAVSPEIPSLLQKRLDRPDPESPRLLLAGSSQRMMQGLVLDHSAPLFGRAREILEVRPLPASWIREALSIEDEEEAIRAFSIWGGVPRYWELASEYRRLEEAIADLVLSPLGVLHSEPDSLLMDDLRDTVQAASILSLIGQGCHRLSEIAGRLGKPATALSRPLQRLVLLGFVKREVPFGVPERDSKRNLYRIDDPFLRFWFRWVDPNRSRLQAGQTRAVSQQVMASIGHQTAGVWEDLVRRSVLRHRYLGRTWVEVGRWWGAGTDRRPHEIDVVARTEDGRDLLLGEVDWESRAQPRQLAQELVEKAARFPEARDASIRLAVWTRSAGARSIPPGSGVRFFGPADVLRVLR